MTVLLFGVTRDIVKKGALELNGTTARDIQTVRDLKAYLVGEYPGLGELSSLAVAVNQHYAGEDDPLSEIDEIALIPPVSGG